MVDFESYSSGTIIDSEYAPQLTVSAVSASLGPDVAVIFDTVNPTGGDADLGGLFDTIIQTCLITIVPAMFLSFMRLRTVTPSVVIIQTMKVHEMQVLSFLISQKQSH